ncbi:hypothetical protein NIES2100_74380 [Calothrix sp. NIES-2100]|nr:hypothetical protein NIES2100_74380 [Calothrix sp. NIES-2100]
MLTDDVVELICGRLNVQKCSGSPNISVASKAKKNLAFIPYIGNEGFDYESQSFYVIKLDNNCEELVRKKYS